MPNIIGTAPNQVPTNADLGSMAYQDSNAVKVKDITFNDGSSQQTAASGFGFKNRIINGDMRIDQRNAGASINIVGGTWPVDRFVFNTSQDNKGTSQQSTTAPAGFSKSLLLTSTSAYTVGASEVFSLEHRFEGFNTEDLGFGTASASTVTVSFWVRSSLTGAFGGALTNSARNRSYPFSYTISAANTWEQKSITIAGDTTGTWPTDNSRSMILIFSLGAGSTYSGTAGAWAGSAITQPTGSTSLVGTNGATFYITGVQLEKGSTATSFDYRPYGTELALCQRYCPVFDMGSGNGDAYRGFAANTTLSDYSLALMVAPRVPPTGITTSGTFGVGNGAAGANATAVSFQAGGNTSINIRATTTAGSPTLSQGVGTAFYGSSSGKIICTGCEL